MPLLKILKISKQISIPIKNKTKIRFVKDRPGHDFRYALNSSKILKKLKWKARIKFDKGLMETIKWYSENKNFLSQFSKKKYDKRLGLKV